MASWMGAGVRPTPSHRASVVVPVRCAEGCDRCPENAAVLDGRDNIKLGWELPLFPGTRISSGYIWRVFRVYR